MSAFALAVIFSCVVGAATLHTLTDACHGQAWGEAGEFDFHVLEQTWPAQFCYDKDSQVWPGCVDPTDFMMQYFIIHGLWPRYWTPQSGHAWPQCCDSIYGPTLNASVVRSLYNDLLTFWPNLQDVQPVEVDKTLWNHEWERHGTCSGLSPMKFLSAAMYSVYMQVQTPLLIRSHIGTFISSQALQQAYKQRVVLHCTHDELVAIQSCFSPVYEWISCPLNMHDTCPDDRVYIREFQVL